MATRCRFRGRRGILWDVLKIYGSLARNIDFGVANFQVLRKTRLFTYLEIGSFSSNPKIFWVGVSTSPSRCSFTSTNQKKFAKPRLQKLNFAFGNTLRSKKLVQKNGQHVNMSEMTIGISALLFPESVWAKGSSNSGGLSTIFTSSHLLMFASSHLHIFSSSHLLIFSSSHLLIFTSAHLHIFSSSHLLIFTSAHLHICSSSHLLIFTSAHLHIFSSSQLLIFTFSHLHSFSSSRLHILTSSHLHILASSRLLIFTSFHLHIFTPSHPHIFSSSHLHIFSSSHLHIFTSSPSLLPSCSLALLLSCPLALLPSCSLALLLSPSCLFLSWRRGAVPTRRHETQPFRTKWGSIAKHWGKIAISQLPRQPFRTKWGSIAKIWSKIAIAAEVVKSQFYLRFWREMTFDRQELRWNCDFTTSAATLSHEMTFDRQNLR